MLHSCVSRYLAVILAGAADQPLFSVFLSQHIYAYIILYGYTGLSTTVLLSDLEGNILADFDEI